MLPLYNVHQATILLFIAEELGIHLIEMTTNLRQQKRVRFWKTLYNTVATLAYKFGTETVQLMRDS